MQCPGLHLAQGCPLRVGGDRVPGDVPGSRRLSNGDSATLHDRRLLCQKAPCAQDGEQEAAQAKVRLPLSPSSPGSPRPFWNSAASNLFSDSLNLSEDTEDLFSSSEETPFS